jgi:ribonuclease-3
MAKRTSAAKESSKVKEVAEATLEDRLRYRFRDPARLQLALTHSSLAFEAGDGRANATGDDNEQLEFLGDAIVGLVVTELLVKHFPERREGDLTRMRAMLVSGKGMGEVGVRLGLGRDLQLGRGEDASGGRTKSALLADAVEAIVAAIYLDATAAGTAGAGLKAARTFVEREIFQPRLADLRAAAQQGARFGGAVGDWKSALQELLQARAAGQPQYRTVEEIGNDHNKRFRVEVALGDQVLAGGEGTSKKSAQQAAARVAYDLLSPEVDAGAGTAVGLEVGAQG